jgi:hypothetical protein
MDKKTVLVLTAVGIVGGTTDIIEAMQKAENGGPPMIDGHILVQIIGAPIACADGVKDSWRDVARWAEDQLKRTLW